VRFQLGFQLGFLLGALGYVGTYVSTNIPIDQRNIASLVALHHSCVFIHDIGRRCVSKGGFESQPPTQKEGCRGSASASLPRNSIPVALTAWLRQGYIHARVLTWGAR
jgi:hypothetical protein